MGGLLGIKQGDSNIAFDKILATAIRDLAIFEMKCLPEESTTE